MTDIAKGLADILSDYTSAMNSVEHQDDPAVTPGRPRRVLLPADQQRGCVSPSYGSSPRNSST